MQNQESQLPHVTIDDIEFDLPRFQNLLATHSELTLMDQGIPVARVLPPIKEKL